ncbi:MAG: GntR family transcriptional regulator [Rhodobacteraceae bacterium]|nr:GntR family transcriptional regulator [Paracoccaceae bacterium]
MQTLDRGPSLTDRAAREIRDRIVGGGFRAGESLSEITLAQALGISKTPVREALMVLKRQGLVEVHPQRGSFVFDMDADQVRALSDLREVLELAALRRVMDANRDALAMEWARLTADMGAALAAGDTVLYRRLDGVFHQVLIELTGNAYLVEAYELIAFRIQALRSRLSVDPGLNASSFADHARLAELAARDAGDQAADLMARHIAATLEFYLAAVEVRESTAEPPAASGRGRKNRP